MKLQVTIRKGSVTTKKTIHVSARHILSMLSQEAANEILEKLRADAHDDIDGYIYSITDKD